MIRLINTTTSLPIDKVIEASFIAILEKDFKDTLRKRLKACPEWFRSGYIDVQFVSQGDLFQERESNLDEQRKVQSKIAERKRRTEIKKEARRTRSEDGAREPLKKDKDKDENNYNNLDIDFLGIYIPHHLDNHKWCIKVSPELVMAMCKKLKTNKQNLPLEDLYPTILLAVVIHELAHLLMDHNFSVHCCTSGHLLTQILDNGARIYSHQKDSDIRKRSVPFIISPYCKFHGNGNSEISPNLQEWRHVVEESLANAFVLNQNFKPAQRGAIMKFIESQPFAYKAGLQWNCKFQDLLHIADSWRKFKAKCFRSKWDSKFSQKGVNFPLEVLEGRLKNEEKIVFFDFESELDQYIKDHQQQWQKEFEVDKKMNLIVLNGDLKDGKLDYSGIEIDGFFDCTFCKNLKSLAGAPKKVTGDVDCSHCSNVTSLEGIGRDYLNEIGGHFIISSSVKSNILGLLKVTELKHITYTADAPNELRVAIKIINKYLLSDGPNFDDCEYDLVEAGLKEYAKL